MNIIFLDVDGVLNSGNNLINVYNETHKPHSGYSYPFDSKCLENLKELVEKTNSYIVISSKWRYACLGMKNLLETLSEYNLRDLVIGCTPKLGLSRGAEIEKFLCDFKYPGEVNFVILDDRNDIENLLPYLVQTNRQVGLTRKNVEEAIEILTNNPIKQNNGFKR